MERTYKRCEELYGLDMKISETGGFIGDSDINKDFNVSMIEIQFDNDIEWQKKIKSLKEKLNERRCINVI